MISRPSYLTDPLCDLRPGTSIWASVSLSQRIQPTLTFQNPATLLPLLVDISAMFPFSDPWEGWSCNSLYFIKVCLKCRLPLSW